MANKAKQPTNRTYIIIIELPLRVRVRVRVMKIRLNNMLQYSMDV